MADRFDLLSRSDKVMTRIVSRKLDTSQDPPMVRLLLSCGCTVTRPLPRVPRGDNMYCESCRDKNRKSKS